MKTDGLSEGRVESLQWVGRGIGWGLIAVIGLFNAILIAAASRNDDATGFVIMSVMVLLVVINFSVLRVRITDRDVTVSFLTGFPQRIIPLGVIREAYAKKVHGLRVGGWGLRGGSTFLVRSGPALVIESDMGRIIATVENPEGAVATLYALVGHSPS